jgi:hypothetical protein
LPRQVYLLLIKPAFAGRTLQPLRYLHSCSGCFRLERSPGGACTRWKAPPLHGARHNRSFRQPKDRFPTDRFARCCRRRLSTVRGFEIPKAAARSLSMPKTRRPSAAYDVELALPTHTSPSTRSKAVGRPARILHVPHLRSCHSWLTAAGDEPSSDRLGRTALQDWVRPFEFVGRTSAAAQTGRSGFAGAEDRSTPET